MKVFLLAAALFAIVPTTAAFAAGGTEDRADFTGYIKQCMESHPGEEEAQFECVEDQVTALNSYIGDILGETAGFIGDGNVEAMNAAQDAWLKYRDATCDYHAQITAEKEGVVPKIARLFCVLRLNNARIAEIRASYGFASPMGTDE